MTDSNTDMLNINQTPEELQKLYEDDYYWYLRSPEFQDTFLSRIGWLCNFYTGSSGRILDVGCGEGQLAEYIGRTFNRYYGFDGSVTAIRKNREIGGRLLQGRIEDPPFDPKRYRFDVVVFGGILEVLIKPERRLDFVNLYRDKYTCRYFIVYDLERLDTLPLMKVHQLLYSTILEAQSPKNNKGESIPAVKLRRKIMVFEYNL